MSEFLTGLEICPKIDKSNVDLSTLKVSYGPANLPPWLSLDSLLCGL